MNTTCIFCGEPVILGSFQKYTGGFYRQTYICRSCGRQYVDNTQRRDEKHGRNDVARSG